MTHSVLVTGAHGFLGRYVARHFARNGWLVTGMGHGTWSESEFREWGLSFWHNAPVELDALVTYGGEPDVIVHCAGSGSVSFSLVHPREDFLRTVSSTSAVLEYVRKYSPMTRVAYPSSAAVYGNAEQLPIKESQPLKPASPYGLHKRMAEQLCLAHAAHFGLKLGVVRFFSIYGEHLKKQLLWDACNKLSQGEHSFFGSGGEVRDWLHAEDAATLLAASALHADASCPIVNGGSGEGVAVREILAELFDEFGVSSGPEFSDAPRAGDPRDYQADISCAAQWGWAPLIGWRQGVRRYVRWFRENLR